MNIGTRSLLFGCHQFILHPLFVIIAWVRVNRLIGTKLTFTHIIASIIHDWGYWGCREMDGNSGLQHPIFGANLIYRITGSQWWYEECLLHSRHWAKKMERIPSNFCWVDKLSVALMPPWLWAILAYLSGEGWEYMENLMYETYETGRPHTLKALIQFHKRYVAWADMVTQRYYGVKLI